MDGIAHIRRTIARYGISCGVLEADALYVADGRTLAPEIRKEHECRRSLGLDSRYYAPEELPEVLGTDRFHGGLRFGGTFGMSGLDYAQGLRNALIARGVRVYENTPAQAVEARAVRTLGGSVRAKHVVVCVDHAAPYLGVESRDVYHQQNFITVSEPLGEDVRRRLFPSGPLLVYDTHVLYHYFRLLPEGRLILGGGLSRKAYERQPSDAAPAVRHLVRWIRSRFPFLEEVEFTHGWPGFFGLSKDLIPIAGRVADRTDGSGTALYVALCGGGMTWSCMAGQVAARAVVGEGSPLDPYFRPGRAFTTIEPLLAPLPKPTAFELSHLYTKSALRGTAEEVERKQRYVRAAALAGFTTAGMVAGNLLWRGIGLR
jgi:gamma-glutamylputrescine oxidase